MFGKGLVFGIAALFLWTNFVPTSGNCAIVNDAWNKNGNNYGHEISMHLVSPFDVLFNDENTSVEVSDYFGESLYQPHGLILINGNRGFRPSNGVTSGSGTKNDPYIIEGWAIKPIITSQTLFNGITVKNTDAFFVIKNCYIYNWRSCGIVFDNVKNGVIDHNVITGNGCGIYFSLDLGGGLDSYNIISNNSIVSNDHGIYFYESWSGMRSYNIISHNNILRNSYGIDIYSSDYNQIIYNNITSNKGGGIWLGYTNYGVITDNTEIHHNNFIDNIGLQVWDLAGVNHWDDGYPSGGNYWSDYLWGDYFSGPNQDIPGSDGIGDKPYYVTYYEDYNRDSYPSIEPINIDVNNDDLLYQQSNNQKMNSRSVNQLSLTSLSGEKDIFANLPIELGSEKSTVINFDETTLYVGGSGPGNYTKIQDAIDNASDGDTVFVYDDSAPYYEQIIVDKTINLIGEKKDTTIIDGGGVSDVIQLIADGVTFSSFTIQNGNSGSGSGIYIHSNYSTISGNIVLDNYYGIQLKNSRSNSITDNSVSKNTRESIRLNGFNSRNNIVQNIMFLSFAGIYIITSDNNTILENFIFNNYLGMYVCNNARDNIISNNIIQSNEDCGITFQDASVNNIVKGNTIVHNAVNIGFGWSTTTNNTIAENTLSHSNYGISIRGSINNNIFLNNFIHNNQNAYDESTNNWYKSGVGNYWDDYQGFDSDGNGIGDTPYNIVGHSPVNKDSYPLMIAYNVVSSPPNKPIIDGPTGELTVFLKYGYTAFTTDPNGDTVRYLFDWGDGTITWSNYYNSGETVKAYHRWIKTGNYEIKVKSRDKFGYESPWSDPLAVALPLNQPNSQNSNSQINPSPNQQKISQQSNQMLQNLILRHQTMG